MVPVPPVGAAGAFQVKVPLPPEVIITVTKTDVPAASAAVVVVPVLSVPPSAGVLPWRVTVIEPLHGLEYWSAAPLAMVKVCVELNGPGFGVNAGALARGPVVTLNETVGVVIEPELAVNWAADWAR